MRRLIFQVRRVEPGAGALPVDRTLALIGPDPVLVVHYRDVWAARHTIRPDVTVSIFGGRQVLPEAAGGGYGAQRDWLVRVREWTDFRVEDHTADQGQLELTDGAA